MFVKDKAETLLGTSEHKKYLQISIHLSMCTYRPFRSLKLFIQTDHEGYQLARNAMYILLHKSSINRTIFDRHCVVGDDSQSVLFENFHSLHSTLLVHSHSHQSRGRFFLERKAIKMGIYSM